MTTQDFVLVRKMLLVRHVMHVQMRPMELSQIVLVIHELTIIAICSPNCVQIYKGRDREMVFCRARHKKCRAKGETFFMSNPVKIVFR